MTLEAELEYSSVQTDDYAWHDFLTERDFRPEDLWEFDCEASVGSTPRPSPERRRTSCDDPAERGGTADAAGTADAGTARAGRGRSLVHLSQLVWECAAPKPPAGLAGKVVLTGLENLNLGDTADTLKDLAELRSWVDAMEARLVAKLSDGTRDDVLPHFPEGKCAEDMARSVAASEVAFTLNIPERSARRLVEESVHLTMKHPATLEALEAGSISRRHAVLIADESLGMPPEAVVGFERALLGQARGMTVAKLARRARRLREEHHPETLPIRKAKAESERHVELQPGDDGMAWLHAYLPAEQACGIYQRLTASSRKLKTSNESRTLTQLRADVFTDILTSTNQGEVDGCEERAWQGITAHVNVTVPVLALLDVLAPGDQEAGDTDRTVCSSPRGLNQFAELEGYGPIDTATAARLAAHAPSFTRILTHPITGSVLDVGRETYRPPKHLQDWVRARDRTCRHPGCSRAAIACEIDHTIPWARGGKTSHCNLSCFCPKHHMYKSEGIFAYSQPSPGIIVVRSRAGTARTSTPDPPF